MNVFEKYDNAQSLVIGRFKKFVVDVFPYLILIANLLFLAASRLFRGSISTVFSDGFFSQLFLNVLTSTVCYACFLIYSENVNKSTLKGYVENCQTWGEASYRVRLSDRFEDFLGYCREQVENEREERRTAYITNHTHLTLSDYNENYKSKSRKELKSLLREGKISYVEYRYILKANGNIRVKPINPLLILCGSQVNHINDVGRTDSKSVLFSILSRPVSMAITTVVLAMMNFAYIGFSDEAVIFDMLVSAFTIIFSAFLGYSKGVTNIRVLNDLIKARIIFIERFEKNNIISTEKVPS